MLNKIAIGVAVILSGLALLASCVGISIDEASVFRPPPVANKAEHVDDMYIEWQDVFERPSNFTFTNNINNDHATIRITKDEFVPTKVTHGFWANGTIAVTEMSASSTDRPLVIHCGGNASDRYGFGALFGLKIIPYADLVIFDYPGYGDSPGKPSASSFEEMLDNLAEEIHLRRDPERPLVLWGYSLGGFVCAELSKSVTGVDAVVIESSAKDARSAARELVPWLIRPFVKLRLSPSLSSYNNASALMDFEGQVLVLAGQQDGILPSTLSEALVTELRSAGVAVSYQEFPDGNHANLATLPAFRRALDAFFSDLEVSQS